MARYVFTARDLAPLRPLLDLPLARAALGASVPVKRFDPAADRQEPLELPIEVQSRAHPDGVPLAQVLERVKRDAPSASGVVVRGGRAIVSYDKPPSKGQRAAVDKLLTNREALLELRRPPIPEHRLEAVLASEAVTDAEWLPAFRRWAVDNVIKPG